MDISVVIPFFNEAESLPELSAWIERVMKDNNFSYEVLMIDDGSTDGSWDIVKGLSAANPAIHGISFRRNYGKSAALYCGFAQAQGEVVITMDADLQDSPDEIPALVRKIKEEGFDIVSGWKQHRKDNPITKNLPSKLYNATARRITGIKLHDMNCGLKAYRKEVVKNVEVYGEMHRYIPYLAKNAGFTKIGEMPVHHQKRKYGKSKFGMDRFVNGFLDVVVSFHFRQEAHAFLRLFRNLHVPGRFRDDSLDYCREISTPVPWSRLSRSHRPAPVLSCLACSSPGCNAVPGRIHRRNDRPLRFREE